MMVFKKILRWLTPYGLLMLHRQKAQQKNMEEYGKMREKMKEIKNYFLSLNYNEQKHEFIEIIDFFRKYKFSVFPYEFSRKYLPGDVDVFYDEKNKTSYVIYENKRLYFPNEWSIEHIQSAYSSLSLEQDENSPHRYETKEFAVKEGDVIADIGAAEGIWALHNIEKAQKAYLFECDPIWISALRKTFEPWKEKVVIVNKYVSDMSGDKNVTLNSYFKGKKINFIKADIEGMELKMLKGGNEILRRNDRLGLLLCTYHREGDAAELKEFLEQNGFATEYSNGYMLFVFDNNLKEPYVRHGLIRGKK